MRVLRKRCAAPAILALPCQKSRHMRPEKAHGNPKPRDEHENAALHFDGVNHRQSEGVVGAQGRHQAAEGDHPREVHADAQPQVDPVRDNRATCSPLCVVGCLGCARKPDESQHGTWPIYRGWKACLALTTWASRAP